MSRKVLFAALFITAAVMSPLFAGKAIGEIIYFSGDVSIARNGKVLGPKQFKFGDALEDYDLIRTGSKGTMDLVIRTPKNQAIQLQVQNNTSFFIEISKLSNGNDRTAFEMMTGTLSCKVEKISGGEVQVRTKSAAMGVRGTQFMVSTAPTDDMLVTCDEGLVSCTDENGRELFAKPGEVVELLADEEQFRSLPVSKEELEKYRRNWFVGRLQAFKANASRVIKSFAVLFEKSYTNLVSAYNDLWKKKGILEKWIEEDAKGLTPPRSADLLREKREIIGLLFKIKGNLFIFERVYFRLLELEYYFGQGYGSGNVKPGLSIKQFFADLRGKKDRIETMISNIQYFFKLYAKRNDGYFPVDTMGSDDTFFGDKDSDFFN